MNNYPMSLRSLIASLVLLPTMSFLLACCSDPIDPATSHYNRYENIYARDLEGLRANLKASEGSTELIELAGLKYIPEEMYSALDGAPNLGTLIFSTCDHVSFEKVPLKTKQVVRLLTIEGCKSLDFRGLSSFESLSTLQIKYMTLRSTDFLNAKGPDSLKSLRIVRSSIADHEVFSAFGGLDNLKELELLNVEGLSLSAIAEISKWSHIEEVALYSVDVRKADLLPLTTSSSLKFIVIKTPDGERWADNSRLEIAAKRKGIEVVYAKIQ